MAVRVRIIALTVLLSLIFAVVGLLINTLDIKIDLISPLSNGFSISSLFGNKTQKHEKFIYGFLPYWNIKETENLKYEHLTDVAYFGLYINPDGSIKKYDSDGNIEPGYNNWKNNQDLKKSINEAKKYGTRYSLTLISHNDETTENFLNCVSCWEKLEETTLEELSYHKISDVHLNFEYSTYTDKELTDKFTKFVKHYSNFIKEHDSNSILAVSAFADSNRKQRITDIKEISSSVDLIFIMGYDFRTSGSEYAGPTAPLDGIGTVAEYDIRTTVKDYIANAPTSKILLGVPYYGYNWPVTTTEPYSRKSSNNVLGTTDFGARAQTYQDIMQIIETYNIQPKWDDVAKVPYFTYYNSEHDAYRQVYYENKESLKYKFDYANEMQLAGVGIWALGYDGRYLDLWHLLESYDKSK